jgi:peptidyl-prolyl cis-trans isomerase SurA
MKLRLTALFLSLISVSVCQAQPRILDKVIAVIGKNPLLLSEVETSMLQEKEKSGDTIHADNRCKIFEDILFQKLLLSQADRDSIVVADAELDGELAKRINYYVSMLGGEEKFEAFYGKRINVFKEELRDDVRNQLLAQKMQQKITGDVKLTPSEVRAYFNTLNVDSFPLINSELEIAHIVKKPPVTDQAKTDVRTQLELYRQRVLKGESMSVIAALYSEDPGSAKTGGRYEFMRGQMVPEFEAVAFRLKPGEVSEIFQTNYGLHFIQLIARKGESADVRHILLTPKTSQSDVYNAKLILDSIRDRIEEGQISFQDAALKYSDDLDTRQNGGMLVNPATASSKWQLEELGQMDQTLVFMFENQMKVGDVSPVIQYIATGETKQGWRILCLKSRSEPHKINYKDDYSKLLNMATYDKQKTLITAWIAKKSKTTYIKLDEEFNSCKLQYSWTITP